MKNLLRRSAWLLLFAAGLILLLKSMVLLNGHVVPHAVDHGMTCIEPLIARGGMVGIATFTAVFVCASFLAVAIWFLTLLAALMLWTLLLIRIFGVT